MKWKAPPIWRGSTVFVIGGGPSVAGADLCLNYEKRRRLFENHVIGVNNAGFLDEGVDILFFGDGKWHDWNKGRLKSHNTIIVTNNPKFENFPRIRCLARDGAFGLISKRRDSLKWNSSSGGAAIALAALLGAKKIVLIGFDMHHVNNKKNFHVEHLERNPINAPYKRHLKCFPFIAHDAKKLGITIINTTFGSAITAFPIQSLSEVLDAL